MTAGGTREQPVCAVMNRQPSTKLKEALVLRRKKDLCKTAKVYGIRGLASKRKEELIDCIVQVLTDRERMAEYLLLLELPAWRFFQRAMKGKVGRSHMMEKEPCDALQESGLLQVFRNGDAFCCVVPDEVREVCHALENDGFVKRKKRADLLHTYAVAAANLYGVIPLHDLLALFNSQNKVPAAMEELRSVVSAHSQGDCVYLLWEEYLVHSAFRENNFEDVPDLLAQIGEKPRYVPERQELLRYQDPEYYEETLQTKALRQYLCERLDLDRDLAALLVAEFYNLLTVDAKPQHLFQLFDEYRIQLAEENFATLSDLIAAMSYHTRRWSHNGHTPKEIAETQNGLAEQQRRNQKVGRNDLCPCGSGKKYKKCCGR